MPSINKEAVARFAELIKRAQLIEKAAKTEGKEKIISALKEALSDEFAAIQMYTVGSALVSGPNRPALAEYLAEEAPDEQKHAQFLSEKIVALGGTPEVAEREVSFKPVSNRRIFEVVREAEQKAVDNYTRIAQMAEDAGERALQIQIEDILTDEQKHLEDSEKILDGWK